MYLYILKYDARNHEPKTKTQPDTRYSGYKNPSTKRWYMAAMWQHGCTSRTLTLHYRGTNLHNTLNSPPPHARPNLRSVTHCKWGEYPVYWTIKIYSDSPLYVANHLQHGSLTRVPPGCVMRLTGTFEYYVRNTQLHNNTNGHYTTYFNFSTCDPRTSSQQQLWPFVIKGLDAPVWE
jgi:hypothetical protein